MTRHQQLLGMALLFIAGMTGLGIWAVLSPRPDADLSQPAHWNSMRVGYAIEAPFAFVDDRGEVTGEAPEVFRAVAGRLGIRDIDWIRLDFASLLPELQVGRVDAVVSGLYVTTERQRQAAFSRPTARIRTALVHRANDIRLPSQAQQLDAALEGDTGLRWAAINASFEEARLLEQGTTEDRLQRVQDVFTALGALRDGSVDMFVISELTARHHGGALREHGLVYRTLEAEPAGRPAFAFRHGDEALRQAIDAELARFLGSAEHLDLVNRFGLARQELVP